MGNICRSPMAEGIFRAKVAEKGLIEKLEIDSAGTSGYHDGEAPDSRAQETTLEHNIDISNQKSRKFIAEDFQRFDLIYVMDQSNYDNVIELASSKEDHRKVTMILDETVQHRGMSVPDPYFGGDEGFHTVYTMLDEACGNILEKLNV